MSIPVFPVFAVKVKDVYVIAGGGGGDPAYGKQNGVLVYDLSTYDDICWCDTNDDVIDRINILEETIFLPQTNGVKNKKQKFTYFDEVSDNEANTKIKKGLGIIKSKSENELDNVIKKIHQNQIEKNKKISKHNSSKTYDSGNIISMEKHKFVGQKEVIIAACGLHNFYIIRLFKHSIRILQKYSLRVTCVYFRTKSLIFITQDKKIHGFYDYKRITEEDFQAKELKNGTIEKENKESELKNKESEYKKNPDEIEKSMKIPNTKLELKNNPDEIEKDMKIKNKESELKKNPDEIEKSMKIKNKESKLKNGTIEKDYKESELKNKESEYKKNPDEIEKDMKIQNTKLELKNNPDEIEKDMKIKNKESELKNNPDEIEKDMKIKNKESEYKKNLDEIEKDMKIKNTKFDLKTNPDEIENNTKIKNKESELKTNPDEKENKTKIKNNESELKKNSDEIEKDMKIKDKESELKNSTNMSEKNNKIEDKESELKNNSNEKEKDIKIKGTKSEIKNSINIPEKNNKNKEFDLKNNANKKENDIKINNTNSEIKKDTDEIKNNVNESAKDLTLKNKRSGINSVNEEYIYTIKKKRKSGILNFYNEENTIDKSENWHSFFVVEKKIHKVLIEDENYVFIFQGKKRIFKDEICEIYYNELRKELVFFTRGQNSRFIIINSHKEDYIPIEKITSLVCENNAYTIATGNGFVFVYTYKNNSNILKLSYNKKVYKLPLTSATFHKKYIYFTSFNGLIDRKHISGRPFSFYIKISIILTILFVFLKGLYLSN